MVRGSNSPEKSEGIVTVNGHPLCGFRERTQKRQQVGEEVSLLLALEAEKKEDPWIIFANGAYRASLMNVAWKENGSLLGIGNPFVYKGIAPASGVIDAEAEIKFIEAFDPPAKEGVSSFTEGIPFSVVKEELKIRRKGQALPAESFSMKYKQDRVFLKR